MCVQSQSLVALVCVVQEWRGVAAPIVRQAAVLPAGLLLWHLLGNRLVMVRPETLALAGCDHTNFVSPGVSVQALQLDPSCPGVRRNATVVCGTISPPLPADNRIGHEMGGQALA